jgi:hypothetical protein
MEEGVVLMSDLMKEGCTWSREEPTTQVHVPSLEYGMSLQHRIITLREAMQVEQAAALKSIEEQRAAAMEMLEESWQEAGYEKEIRALEAEIQVVIDANAKIGNFKEGRYILKNIARSPPREVDPELFKQAFPEVFSKLATIPLGKAEKEVGENQLIPLLKPQKAVGPKYEITIEVKKAGKS